MPEHIKALIVILFLSFTGFYVAKRIFINQVSDEEFKTWRNSWLVITSLAFLSGNFWFYLSICTIYVIFFQKKNHLNLAFFFLLIVVIPPIGDFVSGLGLVNYLIELNQIRFASLIILLPIALKLSAKNEFSFPKINTDFFVLLYIGLLVLLELRDTTFTDAMRRGFYAYTDIFLPYYVASRSIKNTTQIKTIAIAFVTFAIVVSIIALFEHFKGWLVYRSFQEITGSVFSSQVLLRSGSIRAIASLMGPIILGYFISIALGFYLFSSQYIQSISIKRLGFIILILGLYSPVSRGPWVGAAIMMFVFTSLGPSAFKKIAISTLLIALLLPTLAILPGGDKFLNLIPFVGTTEKGTITYREDLFKNAIIVIERNPLFGSANYLNEPEMQSLKVNGIVDIVNSYIRIALEVGYVGLFLFLGAFFSILFKMFNQIRQIKDKNDEFRTLLRTMTGIVIAIMITIATVSSISIVPIIYWSVIGMSVALHQIVKQYIKIKV